MYTYVVSIINEDKLVNSMAIYYNKMKYYRSDTCKITERKRERKKRGWGKKIA